MADPVVINPTLTLAGQAAAFNASGTGLELKITHVSFGTAHYDPTGDEVALVNPVGNKVAVAGASRPTPYQIRMVSSWREDVGQVAIGEIAWWAGETLVFVWSKADGTLASYKTDGVAYVLFNDLSFSSVPANSISFTVDPDESVALAALAAHEGAHNAHPQYVLRAKFPDYQGHLWGDVGGSANAITLTLPEIVELTSYLKGNRFSFKAIYTNTGATTINIDGVGPVEVLKTGGASLTAGSIIAGGVYDVYYDGAKFQLTAGAGFASAEATQEEVTGTTAVQSTSWVSVRRLLQAMALKANLANPAFTGSPTVPTPAPGNKSQLVANTEFVMTAIASLVASSPAALDTLSELANALGNDPNFATTILNALALKAPLASPALTGTPTGPTAAPGTNSLQLATTAFVAALGALKANLASPALTGIPTAPTAAPGTNTLQLATTAFVQAALAALVSSSPAALDTLNELAAAIGNDPNFATTMLNALAGKADKGSTLAAYGITDGVKSAKSAGTLTTFNAIVPSNFYFGAGSASASATPGAPPGSSNGALGIIAITPRADFTYYLVFEYSTTKAVSNVWIGRYASSGELFWLSLLTGEFATQVEAEAGADETKPMSAKRVWQAITKRIASQAQVDAGEVDDVIVTPKKLRWGFNAIWGVNGGIAFPSWLGGWIVNWGLQASALSGTISYPIAYTTRAYGIQAQYTHASPSNVNYNITFKDLALSGLSSVPFVSGIANQFQWWGFGK